MEHFKDKRWTLLFGFMKNQGLSIFSLCLVLALAAGAFALSYAGLKDLASTNGVDPRLVWIWPLILDGAIVVFSVCAFRAGLAGESITYPMFLVVLSTIASIAFNVLHAPVPPDAIYWSREVMVPRIMASIPPLALFLSFEVMIRQLKSQAGNPFVNSASSSDDVPTDHKAMEARFGEMFGNANAIEEVVEPVIKIEAESAFAAKATKSPPPKKVVPKNGKPYPKNAAAARALVLHMHKEGAYLDEMAEASNRSPKTVSRYLTDEGLTIPGEKPEDLEELDTTVEVEAA